MGSFATISNGPSAPTDANPAAAPNGLSFDQENNILAFVGKAGTENVAQMRLAASGSQPPLSAITTAQTLVSYALNAGLLNRKGRKLMVRGKLVYNTTSANVATITIALTLGGVTLCTITTAATNTAASTNLPVSFEFLLKVTSTGVAAAIFTHGEVKADIGTAASTAIAHFLDSNVTSNTITVGTNPTAGATITINGTLITFIANGGTPAGNQVALGTTAAATATALYTFLAASTDPNIAQATYTNPSSGVVLAVTLTPNSQPNGSTSVPADITFSVPTVNLTAAQTLAVTIAGGAAIPSAQLLTNRVDLLA